MIITAAISTAPGTVGRRVAAAFVVCIAAAAAAIGPVLAQQPANIAALEQALSTDPENPDLYMQLGEALLAAGNTEKAGKVYRRLADLRPEDCRAHAGMSRAYLAQGLADHAIRSGEEARRLCPEDAATQVGLGKAYVAGKYSIEGIESFRRAIALDPNRLDAYEHLGQLCFERSLYPEAIAVYEAALVRPGLDETSSLVRTANARLGAMYSWGGFNEAALPRIESSLTSRSLDAEGLIMVENAIATDPKCRAHVQLLIGEEWERLGNVDRAKAAYTKAADCPDPEFTPRAREALDRLNSAPKSSG
jgi:Tfp pilus assembly protein PilF